MTKTLEINTNNAVLDNVVKYYDASVIEYKILWLRKRSMAMHFGYYDGQDTSHDDAVIKLNQKLSKLVDIKPSDKVLDAGCGYGGTALWMSENIGCQTVGVTLVPYQVKMATKLADERGLSKKTKFLLRDFSNTNLAANSFDVIVGIESIVHAADKDKFVEEAFRLLRPGGRLLISEYILNDSFTDADKKDASVRRWLDGWAMPSLLSAKQYSDIMKKHGFSSVTVEDWTPHILPSLNRLWRWCHRMQPYASTLRRLKLISNRHYGNLDASLAMEEAYNKKIFRYKVIVAKK